MPALLAHKVVSALPATLEADSIYFVRVGAGFSLYVTNGSGVIVAYALNSSGSGSATLTRHEIDFGAGKRSAVFDISVPGVTAGQKVFASVSLDMPAGVAADELEMDPISLAAHAVATDTIRVIAGAQSKLRGKRAINIMRL